MSYENFEEKHNKDGITDDHRELRRGVLVGYFKKNGKQYYQKALFENLIDDQTSYSFE